MKEPQEPILQFFEWIHLPSELQVVSQPFKALAEQIVRELPRNPERTVALRKLLESKDAAVRAKISIDPNLTESPGPGGNPFPQR